VRQRQKVTFPASSRSIQRMAYLHQILAERLGWDIQHLDPRLAHLVGLSELLGLLVSMRHKSTAWDCVQVCGHAFLVASVDAHRSTK